ncbi:MAG: C2 family cysteine protease [Planctomycetota bacterium]
MTARLLPLALVCVSLAHAQEARPDATRTRHTVVSRLTGDQRLRARLAARDDPAADALLERLRLSLLDPSLAGTRAEGYGEVPGATPFVRGKGDASAVAMDDVAQGALGDCYLLASLIAIARLDPGHLEGLIAEGEPGTFQVTLWHPIAPRQAGLTALRDGAREALRRLRGQGVGPRETFAVNGRIPLREGDAAFARQGDRFVGKDGQVYHVELWPILFEKAFARMHGGFEEIVGGYPAYALMALSGRRARNVGLTFRSDRGIETVLREALDERRPVIVSSKRGAEDLGVVGGHAYVLLEVESGGFRLYNPWGRRHPERPLTARELRRLFHRATLGPRFPAR